MADQHPRAARVGAEIAAARRPREHRRTTRKHADPAMLQPGESWCPVDDKPGQALIDQRGVKIFHARQGRNVHIACRPDGYVFADLVTAVDLSTLGGFLHAPTSVVCPRCRHARGSHIPHGETGADGRVWTVLHGGELRCPCGCPGPGGVIIP